MATIHNESYLKTSPDADVDSITIQQSHLADAEAGLREGDVAGLSITSAFATLYARLTDLGVEARGLEPVPPQKRTDTRYVNVLTLFSATSIGVLPVSTGAVPTLFFGLSLKSAALMIIFLQILFCISSAYIITIAPMVGMRQWTQLRYTYGKYFNIVPSLLTILGLGVFCMSASVTGAEVLVAVRPGTLSVAGAIAILLCCGLVVGFMGYNVLHLFARYAWIPAVFGLLVLFGCAGDQLKEQAPASATGGRPYLATVSLSAGIMYAWGNIIGDYACYMPPNAPRVRLFLYCMGGLALPFSLVMIFGAAVGGAVVVKPTWLAAYQTGGIGGVCGEILIARLGGFGRFVVVILGMSVVPTCARDIYSISLGAQAVIPYLHRVPRFLLAIVTAGVLIAVGILASKSFLSSLSTLVSILGYQAGTGVTVYLIEWVLFRKADPTSLDPNIWNDAKALPSGVPAIITIVVGWGPIVCSMDTAWYTGPLGVRVGDLAWELAIVTALVVYPPLRALEIKYRGYL